MKVLITAKAGMFLVVSCVLAVWTLLATQPVRAHVYNTATTPSCSGLPTDTGFFVTDGSPVATHDITAATNGLSGTVAAKAGATATNSGQTKYLYAKITIPALAAGELRVFDTRTGSCCLGRSSVSERLTDCVLRAEL